MMPAERLQRAHLRVRAAHLRDARRQRPQFVGVGNGALAQIGLRDQHVAFARTQQRFERAHVAVGAAEAGAHGGLTHASGCRR